MEQGRKPSGRTQEQQKDRNENQQQRQQNQPQGLDGLNFEEQRGSLKNSDYGGAIVNTRSGRNSSDVKQEEIKRPKWVWKFLAEEWWKNSVLKLKKMCEGSRLGMRTVDEQSVWSFWSDAFFIADLRSLDEFMARVVLGSCWL